MRFGHTSTLSLFTTAGLAWALAWGCAGKDSGSTFSTGTTGGPGDTSSTTSSSGTISSGTISSGTSSTTTIMTGGSTTGGTGGSTGIDPDANCGATRQGTKQIPIDVLILQDKSGSMQCPAADDTCENPTMPMPPSRWDAMGTALTGFVDSPAPAMAGVSVGLTFFGLSDGTTPCQQNSYQNPVVPIAPLMTSGPAIKTAIGMTMPGGGTPTAPALQGAIAAARAYTTAQMGQRTAAVLLVTDGNPTGCGQNGVMQAVAAAQAGYMGMPQIKTFVVGMGNTMALSQVALAGSGGMQDYIPTMGDVVGTLTKALSTITGMITCNYAIPAGSDPRLVNVQITVGMGGMAQKIGKVANAAACGMPGGWYYDNDAKPTMIILCPQSCDAVKNTPNSGVEVLYGCPSVPPA
jgi:hypothetical protein